MTLANHKDADYPVNQSKLVIKTPSVHMKLKKSAAKCLRTRFVLLLIG